MPKTTEEIIREHYRLVEACHEPSNDGKELRDFKKKKWHAESELNHALWCLRNDICSFLLHAKHQSMKTEADKDCLVQNIEQKFKIGRGV